MPEGGCGLPNLEECFTWLVEKHKIQGKNGREVSLPFPKETVPNLTSGASGSDAVMAATRGTSVTPETWEAQDHQEP